jgi:sensor histidine kinase YesM
MLLAKVTEQTTVEDGPYRLMGIVISGILYLVITRLLCLAKNRKMNLMVPTRYWLMLLIVPILSILATYTVFLFNSFVKVEEMSLLAYITQISLLFINYIAFYLFIKLVEDFNIKTEYKLLKQQVDFQKNHYDDLEISSNEMRSFRHDIKNHLQNLDELIIANKNDEADKYIKSFSDIINISNRVIDTGNSVLDAILNAKLMVIKEKNIPFDYKIEIPNQIKIEPADICVLLGNSLDNAIEACDRIDSNDKKISMILAYGSEGLIYSLSNTTDGNLVANGESFLSSKNNYSEHGLGLLNIEKTTEKYKGIFLTEHKNNNFKLVASLYGA